MAKHEIERDGIIYTFPDDESFRMYNQGVAILDRRGRLINSKTKILIKILEHRVATKQVTPTAKQVFVPASNIDQTLKQEVVDGAKGFARKFISEISTEGAKGLANWFVHEAMPYLVYEKIVPTYKKFKAQFEANQHSLDKALEEQKETSTSSKQLKAQSKIKQQDKMSLTNEVQEKRTHLTSFSVNSSKSDSRNQAAVQEYTEQQRIAFHFIVQFKGLVTRYNNGEVDLQDSVKQLTDRSVIAQFNQTIESNPNIIGMTEYNELARILGRDLFQSGKYIPIKADEIKQLLANTKQEKY